MEKRYKHTDTVWKDRIENEIQCFVNNDGENPIKKSNLLDIPKGIGILIDTFDAGFQRPIMELRDLKKMNICKKHDNIY